MGATEVTIGQFIIIIQLSKHSQCNIVHGYVRLHKAFTTTLIF